MKNQASFIYVIFPFGSRNVSPSAKPIKLALKNTSFVFFVAIWEEMNYTL